ncbi:hypothetical protein MRB53_038665 [Persea americana]|nr:hypothetical protein MRB53_038665 [Persea americana]
MEVILLARCGEFVKRWPITVLVRCRMTRGASGSSSVTHAQVDTFFNTAVDFCNQSHQLLCRNSKAARTQRGLCRCAGRASPSTWLEDDRISLSYEQPSLGRNLDIFPAIFQDALGSLESVGGVVMTSRSRHCRWRNRRCQNASAATMFAVSDITGATFMHANKL